MGGWGGGRLLEPRTGNKTQRKKEDEEEKKNGEYCARRETHHPSVHSLMFTGDIFPFRKFLLAEEQISPSRRNTLVFDRMRRRSTGFLRRRRSCYISAVRRRPWPGASQDLLPAKLDARPPHGAPLCPAVNLRPSGVSSLTVLYKRPGEPRYLS